MDSRRLTVAALVIANLVPLAGVAFLGWRLLDVMLIYWLENGVVGVYNALRMATAGRDRHTALVAVPFFAVHYGMFWLVHGVVVVAMFATDAFGMGIGPPGAVPSGAEGPVAGGPPGATPGAGPPSGLVIALPVAGTVALAPGVLWAVASVALSHGVSYVQTWWLDGERRDVKPIALLPRPYSRVLVLHLTLLGGGFVVALLGAPLLTLVPMVVLKIAVDVVAHLREHGRGPLPAGPAAAAVRAP